MEPEALERFLACGDLHQGFARIYCDQCGHDYLPAYSCKTRYFCPSCHQKRMLGYGEWLEDSLLAPVPDRQYVFALPKLIRPFFRYRRRYLGALCRIVAGLLTTGFRTMDPRGRPLSCTCRLSATL
ncbi:MAG: transposase zinc-binding domain-containing protein [Woeseiaceae bacterium]